MRRPAVLAATSLALLVAEPAWAVKEWYDHYAEAKTHVARERWAEALESLAAAVELKPDSGLNERTYGMNFEVYLPYFQRGLCQLRLKDYASAVEAFNIEERQGAITRNPTLHQELKRLRQEAQDAENQRIARRLRDEVKRLMDEANELGRARKHDEALARLAGAQKAAEALDPDTQRRILEAKERLRAEAAALAETETRARRIEAALAEGTRLLEEGKHAEAIVRFDVVLGLDPGQARARDGKREAQERIRATRTRENLRARFLEGKALVEAGQHEAAIEPLTEAATDPRNTEARALLDEAQATVERIRRQRELRLSIEERLAEGEQLLGARRYPEAQVRFESVLELDPGNARAKERLVFAERMVGELIFNRWLPQRPPVLNVIEPRETELSVESASVALVGSATDERSIDRIEFRLAGRLVGEVSAVPRMDGGESLRNVRFDRVLPLEEGLNSITITALDGSGQKAEQSLQVTRRLRFYETRAFLPAALLGAVGLIGAGLGAQRLRRARALRNRFNPYIAGAPVLQDSMFFGRAKLLARILNVLHHNSLMITGERRIGKTTFLYHLKKVLERDDATDYRFFPVFTDLQGVPESSFFHAVMADVVDGLALSPETLAGLRYGPDRESYDGRDFGHDLQQVLAELKTRTGKRVKLALLIDEVDVLNEYSDRINQRLRSIFMRTFSEHLVAVMSGVGIRRIWNSEGSPWYNFFDEIELSGFSRDEAEALIREPVEGVFRFENEAVERILEESELKPYVIQKFCIHAVNRMLEQGRTSVRREDVEAAREVVLMDRERDEEPPRRPLVRQASA